jgi:DNA polymerase
MPARVMLIGEAPGATEDAQGRPFVGAAGKRLDELLGLAGLHRDEVFITNVVKCRPPGNRRPHVEEIDACAAYLQRQLALVQPELVVTLGDAALKTLGGQGSVTSLHGQVLRKRRYALFVTFHPAAALHNPAVGPLLEQDFRRLGSLLQAKSPERLEDFL